MNDERPGTEQPVEQPAEPVERQPEPELSLTEHEEQFPGDKMRRAVAEVEAAPEAETPQQKRDKDTGQFQEGKARRRAKSQQARPEDIPRINELTRQLREREAELAQYRTPQNGNGHPPTPPAPSQPAPQPTQPAAQPKPGQRHILAAPPFDPEPQETDPRFGGDAFAYLREVAKWSARQESRQGEFDRMVEAGERERKDAETKENVDFATRIDAAKAKYEDFEDVALLAPTRIQKDTIPDIFIRRDDNGAEVLYYLQHPTHAKELDELLRMPELGQVKFLTLLSQRLSSNGSGLIAGTTSIAQPRTIVLPPKPPNVVRTTAQPAHGGIPSDRELSLSEHEHYYPPIKRR